MSKRGNIILKIGCLSMLSIVLIAMMIFLISGGWSIKKIGKHITNSGDYKLVFNETYDLNDIDLLNFQLKSADIEVKYGEDDEVLLEIYENDKSKVDVSLNNKILSVDFSKSRTFCIGFCYNYSKVILYLPKDYSKKIDIVSASGDVSINNYKNADINVTTASGDVKVLGANNLDIDTASGEVEARNIINFNLKTISGDVESENVDNLNGSTTSGDIDIFRLNTSIDFNSVSGDIDIEDVSINANSKITTVSGSVDIEGINLVYVNTSTTSGDVDVLRSDRKSDVELYIKTTSGDIEVQ